MAEVLVERPIALDMDRNVDTLDGREKTQASDVANEVIVASPVAEKDAFNHSIVSPAMNGDTLAHGHAQSNGKGHEDAVEHLTPRTRTPQPRQISRMDSMAVELEFYDDNCHGDYEWVRLPKHREWNVLAVKKTAASERNTANTPLTATRWDGKAVIMWAKMDTGADANTINESTLAALLGEHVDSLIHSLHEADISDFGLIGDNNFKPTHYVELSFHAGKSKKSFHDIPFIVVPDDAIKASSDGVPNLILGLPTLRKHSMVMMDLDYHMEAEAGLEVIAGKAEEENDGIPSINSITFRPPRPGVKRPGK